MSAQNLETVSFCALSRSRTTLEDFVQSYFPYHKLSIPQDFFKYFDVLVWVEATIYQLDEHNEQICSALNEITIDQHVADGLQTISSVLTALGFLDARIAAELSKGRSYWQLERELCSVFGQASHALQHQQAIDATLVIQAHESKSFDYRVLNLLLFKLQSKPYDQVLLDFLFVDELLVDIADDLVDYEDDVLANSFNIFRAFLFMYGTNAELKLVERISQLEKRHKELLTKLPSYMQDHYWQRHKDIVARTGGESWVFPIPVYDEASYRARMSNNNPLP